MVQVLDINGNGIANKAVIAFTWPEPKFYGKQVPYFNNPKRIAPLQNDVQFTNSEGWANFSSLLITGSNDNKVYIFFTVDGTITTLWGDTEPFYGKLVKKQVYFNQAIRIKTTVQIMTLL